MLIYRPLHISLIILVNNLLLAKGYNYTTTTDDPANIDVDESKIKIIEQLREMKKNRSKNFQYNNRIVGGVDTTIQEHPFIVSVQLRDGSHMCGGSLINELWVLSASHCITVGMEADVRDPGDFMIVAGLSDVTRIMDHGQSREVETFIKHPNFGRPLLHNDIALIKMKNPLTLSSDVQIIMLPKYKELRGMDILSKYTECMALGWGAQRPRSGKPFEELTEQEKLEIEQDTISPTLRQVILPVISIARCKDIINEYYITNRHICTMAKYGGKDACEGDSGGPLVCGGQQYGITSWGHGCALPGTPGIFTRVDTYNEWITNILSGGPNVDPYNSSSRTMASVSVLLIISYQFVIKY